METLAEATWSVLGCGGLTGAWVSGLGHSALWKLQTEVVLGESTICSLLFY